MTARIVRLGSERLPGEGLRIGAVRWPPRGVPRAEYATRDFFDVWLPVIAPAADTVRLARGSSDERSWRRFARKYRAEMRQADASRTLDLLAAFSHQTQFSLGCYCEDESRCHRSILRVLLAERGADVI